LLVYYLIFFIPLLGYFFLNSNQKLHLFDFFLWNLILVFFVFVIGYRDQVGGDWDHYITSNNIYANLYKYHFLEIFNFKFFANDFGYILIHWFGVKFGNGIYTTNLIAAAIFVYGLKRFLEYSGNKWFGLTIASPYLITVVSMGFTRQSIAIGLLMLSFVAFIDRKKYISYLYIVLATLMHVSAFYLILIFLLIDNKNLNYVGLTKKYIVSIILFFGLLYLLFPVNIENKIKFFIMVENVEHSAGVWPRLFISALSSLTFLSLHKYWKEKYDDYRILMIFSLITLIFLPLAIYFSALIDRLAVYIIPIQILIFSRLPLFFNILELRYLLSSLILLGYFANLYIWLNFGHYSTYWLPYSNYLMKLLSGE